MDVAAAKSAVTHVSHASREDFRHLGDLEWRVVQRMINNVDESVDVTALFHTLSKDEQHARIVQFIQYELDEAQECILLLEHSHEELNLATTAIEMYSQPISKFSGAETESCLLWFVELDVAIKVRHIKSDELQVLYALSNLVGRAKFWAYNLRVHDGHGFKSLKEFQDKLRDAFDPQLVEFKCRVNFLNLAQGKRDIHAYAQHARRLISNIVLDPIDETTQTFIFIMGLVCGPIKTQLMRERPSTLEEAIRIARALTAARW